MSHLLFIGGIGFQEILVVMLIVLLFYGGKKIPELMRGFGQGVKAFKDGMNETTKVLEEDTTPKEAKEEKKDETV
ncbi:MAG: twin-arginine translocase TatA/TatE family subunit [Bacteroidaceae bacterium]|jgi:sec-independent protein translocase protein TatA|nr:twin-arginine translocase TatA/TatE family subunit [Bacteroidaceae bacterium]